MTAPLVTSLGHAGLRVDAPGLSLLCDPWMSPGGAFLGSWFPYPDNEHVRTPQMLDVDWVAISHEHLDHLDLPLLRGLSPSVRMGVQMSGTSWPDLLWLPTGGDQPNQLGEADRQVSGRHPTVPSRSPRRPSFVCRMRSTPSTPTCPTRLPRAGSANASESTTV